MSGAIVSSLMSLHLRSNIQAVRASGGRWASGSSRRASGRPLIAAVRRSWSGWASKAAAAPPSAAFVGR